MPELPTMTRTEIEDARARHLGYRDAAHYLDQAEAEQARRRNPARWVWSHYRAIYLGQTEGAVRR